MARRPNTAPAPVPTEIPKRVQPLVSDSPTKPVQIPVRMSKEQHKFIKQIALDEDRTIQAVLYRAIIDAYPELSKA